MKQKKLKYSRIFLRDSFYYSKYSTLWKKRRLFLKDKITKFFKPIIREYEIQNKNTTPREITSFAFDDRPCF